MEMEERKVGKNYTKLWVVVSMCIVSAFLTILLGPNANLRSPYNYISPCIGWLYFCAWSVSFYPQVFMNYHRKSVVGLSFDFLAYNLVGFSCYSVYNYALLFVQPVIKEYEDLFHQHVPVVLNDLFFSSHAMLITLFTIIQCCIYERNGQRVSYTAITIICLFIIAILLCIWGIKLNRFSWLTPLTVIIVISNIKLCISFIKYIPQLVFNFKRKSTSGWNIYNILLDFTGGTLSIIQFFMNCIVTGEWSSLKSNLVKLGLGSVSMAFDILFMIQHYCLYAPKKKVDLEVQIMDEVSSVSVDFVRTPSDRMIDISAIKTP